MFSMERPTRKYSRFPATLPSTSLYSVFTITDLDILIANFSNHWILHCATRLQHGRHSNDTSVWCTRRSFLCLRLLWSFCYCSSILPSTDSQSCSKVSSAPLKQSNTGFYSALKKYRVSNGGTMQTRRSSKYHPSRRTSNRWKDFL